MQEHAPTVASPLPRWGVEALGLIAIVVLGHALVDAFGVRHALDCDEANLAYAIRRFSVADHQPHPPGYLGYVALLRLVHTITAAEPLEVTRLVARLGWSGLVVCTFGAARSLPGSRAATALWAAALAALHPIAVYYAIDGQTHAAEAFMSAALVWATLAPGPTSRSRAALVGLLLALGGSFRPSFALVAVVPVLYFQRRDPSSLVRIAAIAALGTLAWLVPTVLLTPGGWPTYLRLNQELAGAYIGVSSALSADADARHVLTNLHGTAIWSVLALAPAGLAWAVASGPMRARQARPLMLLALMTLPSLAFFSLALCAEAGYLSGLVAPAAVAASALLAGETAPERSARAMPALLLLAELGFFSFAPSTVGRAYMMPNASEVFEREAVHQALEDTLAADHPRTTRLLVLTDWPDPTALRQLPLIRPNVHVLHFQDRSAYAFHTSDAITLTTADGAPRDAHEGRCDLRHEAFYDVVVLDPRSSDTLRARITAQASCPGVPLDGAGRAWLWTAGCFADSMVRGPSCAYRFGRSHP